jgi:hypothetical protein
MDSKKLSPERKHYESPICVEERDQQGLSESFHEMDAIARGVEARLDLLTSRSTIVIQKTIDVARQLDMPEEEIQSWATLRFMHDSERNRGGNS